MQSGLRLLIWGGAPLASSLLMCKASLQNWSPRAKKVVKHKLSFFFFYLLDENEKTLFLVGRFGREVPGSCANMPLGVQCDALGERREALRSLRAVLLLAALAWFSPSQCKVICLWRRNSLIFAISFKSVPFLARASFSVSHTPRRCPAVTAAQADSQTSEVSELTGCDLSPPPSPRVTWAFAALCSV